MLLNLYLLRLDYGTEFIGLVNAVGLLTFGLASLPAGILGSRMSTTALMKFGAFTVPRRRAAAAHGGVAAAGLARAWAGGAAGIDVWRIRFLLRQWRALLD